MPRDELSVQSYDAGSLPYPGNLENFLAGAKVFSSLSYFLYERIYRLGRYFEREVLRAFIDKVKAGIDIPNYPQFRDMNEMFLELIRGLQKTKYGYLKTEELYVPTSKLTLPEVNVLRSSSKEIYEEVGEPLKIKICVTGPYTLSFSFPRRDDELLVQLGNIVSKILSQNIFRQRVCEVKMITLDEPSFGLIDDPLIDYGSTGLQNLQKIWKSIFQKCKMKAVKTTLHLHSTSNRAFWDIDFLDVIESHVEDPIYCSKETKRLLDKNDKFLKASIGITDFDKLIRNYLKGPSANELVIGEEMAKIWKALTSKKINPQVFLETPSVMAKRLTKIVNRFGLERVPYAGLECGLRAFPSYECGIDYLRYLSEAVRSLP